MKFFVVTLGGEKFSIDAELEETILDVKNKVCEAGGPAPERQRLIFCGHEYANESTLRDVDIQADSSFHLVEFDPTPESEIAKEIKAIAELEAAEAERIAHEKEQQMELLEQRTLELEMMIATKQAKIDELGEERQNLRESLEAGEKALHETAEELKKEIYQENMKRASMAQELVQYKDVTVPQMEATLKKCESEKEDLLTNCAELRGSLEKERARREELTKTTRTLEKELENVKDSQRLMNRTLKLQMEDNQKKALLLEQSGETLARCRQQTAELEVELKKVKDAAARRDGKSKAVVSKLRKQLKETKTEQALSVDLEDRLALATQERNNFRDQTEALSQVVDSHTSQAAAYEARIAELTVEVKKGREASNAKVCKLREEVATANEQLLEVEKSYARSQQEWTVKLERVTAENEDQIAMITARAEERVAHSEMRIGEMETRMTEAKRMMARAEKNTLAADEKLRAAHRANKEADAEAEKKMAEAEKKMAEAEKKMAEAEKKLSEADKKMTEANDMMTAANRRAEAAKRECTDLANVALPHSDLLVGVDASQEPDLMLAKFMQTQVAALKEYHTAMVKAKCAAEEQAREAARKALAAMTKAASVDILSQKNDELAKQNEELQGLTTSTGDLLNCVLALADPKARGRAASSCCGVPIQSGPNKGSACPCTPKKNGRCGYHKDDKFEHLSPNAEQR